MPTPASVSLSRSKAWWFLSSQAKALHQGQGRSPSKSFSGHWISFSENVSIPFYASKQQLSIFTGSLWSFLTSRLWYDTSLEPRAWCSVAADPTSYPQHCPSFSGHTHLRFWGHRARGWMPSRLAMTLSPCASIFRSSCLLTLSASGGEKTSSARRPLSTLEWMPFLDPSRVWGLLVLHTKEQFMLVVKQGFCPVLLRYWCTCLWVWRGVVDEHVCMCECSVHIHIWHHWNHIPSYIHVEGRALQEEPRRPAPFAVCRNRKLGFS